MSIKNVSQVDWNENNNYYKVDRLHIYIIVYRGIAEIVPMFE